MSGRQLRPPARTGTPPGAPYEAAARHLKFWTCFLACAPQSPSLLPVRVRAACLLEPPEAARTRLAFATSAKAQTEHFCSRSAAPGRRGPTKPSAAAACPRDRRGPTKPSVSRLRRRREPSGEAVGAMRRALLVAGCAAATTLPDIKHFLVLYFENQSFDRIFGCAGLPGARGVDNTTAFGNYIDPNDESKGFVKATCGAATYVCTHDEDHSFPGVTCADRAALLFKRTTPASQRRKNYRDRSLSLRVAPAQDADLRSGQDRRRGCAVSAGDDGRVRQRVGGRAGSVRAGAATRQDCPGERVCRFRQPLRLDPWAVSAEPHVLPERHELWVYRNGHVVLAMRRQVAAVSPASRVRVRNWFAASPRPQGSSRRWGCRGRGVRRGRGRVCGDAAARDVRSPRSRPAGRRYHLRGPARARRRIFNLCEWDDRGGRHTRRLVYVRPAQKRARPRPHV